MARYFRGGKDLLVLAAVILTAIFVIGLVQKLAHVDLTGWNLAPLALGFGALQQETTKEIPLGFIDDTGGKRCGVMVLSMPQKLKLDRSASFVVAILTESSAIDRLSRNAPTLETRQVPNGADVSVNLLGANFAITSLHTKAQRVEWPKRTTWHFNVVPGEIGEGTLQLRAAIDHGSGDRPFLEHSCGVRVEASLAEKALRWLQHQPPAIRLAVWIVGAMGTIGGTLDVLVSILRYLGISPGPISL